MRPRLFILVLIITLFIFPVKGENTGTDNELLNGMHSISSHRLMEYIEELCMEKYGGRLTGTEGYNLSAEWVFSKLKKWGVGQAGDNNTYLQKFTNPYTLVLPGSSVKLHISVPGSGTIIKQYKYQEDFIPGSTSDSGTITAEVVYVGYGITAPELGFDEYKNVDVRGKIVLMDREVPVSSEKEPELFKKWRPYSFHQYKVKNAKDHGAAGMIYIYRIANPNCLFLKDFILTYIGKNVVTDLFEGLHVTHSQLVKKIKKYRKSFSIKTGKTMTITNISEHHPHGIASNVLGMIEGKDKKLKNEVIVLSAHLDHVGRNHELMPGANDNASGVSVLLEVARALSSRKKGLKRSVLFAFFGAEEQGVKGSEYFLNNFKLNGKRITSCINLDGVGRGDKIHLLAAGNFPHLWKYFKRSNEKYIHRILKPSKFLNNARPRLDASHFIWANIPTISISTFGMPLKYSIYHKTLDQPSLLTPEIMEDLAQLLYLSISAMGDDQN